MYFAVAKRMYAGCVSACLYMPVPLSLLSLVLSLGPVASLNARIKFSHLCFFFFGLAGPLIRRPYFCLFNNIYTYEFLKNSSSLALHVFAFSVRLAPSLLLGCYFHWLPYFICLRLTRRCMFCEP